MLAIPPLLRPLSGQSDCPLKQTAYAFPRSGFSFFVFQAFAKRRSKGYVYYSEFYSAIWPFLNASPFHFSSFILHRSLSIFHHSFCIFLLSLFILHLSSFPSFFSFHSSFSIKVAFLFPFFCTFRFLLLPLQSIYLSILRH